MISAAIAGETTAEIRVWASITNICFLQPAHEESSQPGLGRLQRAPPWAWSARGNLRPTRLSPNEQYTQVSMRYLLASPLLLGCDLTQLDEFTLNLLTNDEVLDVDQDPLGRTARRVSQTDDLEVWATEIKERLHRRRTLQPRRSLKSVTANWSDLGLSGEQIVRDLWRQEDLGDSKPILRQCRPTRRSPRPHPALRKIESYPKSPLAPWERVVGPNHREYIFLTSCHHCIFLFCGTSSSM